MKHFHTAWCLKKRAKEGWNTSKSPPIYIANFSSINAGTLQESAAMHLVVSKALSSISVVSTAGLVSLCITVHVYHSWEKEDLLHGYGGGLTFCVCAGIESEWRKTQCMPREVCVDVGREFGAPTNIFYKPPCVSVYRCGGCCHSEDKQCRNISTGYLSKTVSTFFFYFFVLFCAEIWIWIKDLICKSTKSGKTLCPHITVKLNYDKVAARSVNKTHLLCEAPLCLSCPPVCSNTDNLSVTFYTCYTVVHVNDSYTVFTYQLVTSAAAGALQYPGVRVCVCLCVHVCVVRLSFTACFLSQSGALPEAAPFSVGP